MQIKTKFITDNAVTGQKIRLSNAEYLRGRNAANSADINIIRVNAANAPELGASLAAAGFNIVGLADPVNPQDAATKNYVDLAIQGLSPKTDVAAATTAALAAVTYANGTAGVGATLTANANGVMAAVDGYTPVASDRILVKDQVAGLQNGIYVVTSIGSVGTPFVLTRATDCDVSGEIGGAYTVSRNGTVNADHFFICTTTGAIVVGTTAIAFADYGQFTIVSGNGISKTGATVSTNNGPGLGYSGAQNAVLVNNTVSSGTNKINGSNQVEGLKAIKETFTLISGDITNQYVDLAQVAHLQSITVTPVGGPAQTEGTDYTLNYTGGAGSKTRISFAGDLATGGAAALVATDILIVKYQYL